MAARRARFAALTLAALAACGGDGGTDAIADGTHFGFVRALDPAARELVFDPAELVEGATEEELEVRDPDDDTVRLAIDAELEVLLLKPCCEPSPHSFDEWLAGFEPGERSFYGTSASRYELTVTEGAVIRVEEQYLP